MTGMLRWRPIPGFEAVLLYRLVMTNIESLGFLSLSKMSGPQRNLAFRIGQRLL